MTSSLYGVASVVISRAGNWLGPRPGWLSAAYPVIGVAVFVVGEWHWDAGWFEAFLAGAVVALLGVTVARVSRARLPARRCGGGRRRSVTGTGRS